MIETPRLILRPFTIDDYNGVYEFGSNKEVQKYTGNKLIESPEEAKELIKNVNLADYEKYGYGRWATIYKPDTKIIGFAGLKYLPEIDESDLGYRFLPQYWNKGIATEASFVTVKYGFEVLKLKRIIGITMAENIASQRVLEKVGLTFYKIDEYMGDGGSHRWYCLSREDYFNL